MKVLQIGDEHLNKIVPELTDLTKLKSYQALIDGMIEVCKAMKGMACASNQVGESVRMFVMMNLETREFKPYFNPWIVEGNGRNRDLEGCLSFREPEVQYYVRRKTNIKLRYIDIEGNEQIEDFEGLEARCIQHELNHLDGITFDKIGKKK